MTTALELAARLTAGWSLELAREGAAELRRLSAENEQLRAALSASTHILHLPPGAQGACKCSQCDFVRLRDAALKEQA